MFVLHVHTEGKSPQMFGPVDHATAKIAAIRWWRREHLDENSRIVNRAPNYRDSVNGWFEAKGFGQEKRTCMN